MLAGVKSKIVLVLLFCILFFLRLLLVSQLDLQDGQKIRLTGVLTQEPVVSGTRQQFALDQIKILTDRYPEYHYGDRLEIVGKIKDYMLAWPEIKVVGAQRDAPVFSVIVSLKNKIKNIFQRSFPQPLNGILAGIVLGDTSLLPEAFIQALRNTGTIHIMVASGTNISYFAGPVLSFFLYFFKRREAIFFMISVMWIYSFMIGWQPPITRAIIMCSLTYFAQVLGKEAEAKRVLFLTAGIMLFISPKLIGDLGFQLSFLATAGLVYLTPIFKKKVRSETLASTMAAQLATLPVLVLTFGQVNWFSPVINLLVLWPVPYLLGSGMVMGLLGLVSARIAGAIGLVLYPLLFYLERIINFFAQVTFFQLHV